jgi:hypothetical protein
MEGWSYVNVVHRQHLLNSGVLETGVQGRDAIEAVKGVGVTAVCIVEELL